MSLKCNTFIAAAAAAFSGSAIAQTTPPTTTTPTTTTTTQTTPPDEAVPGHGATAPGQMQTTPGQAQAVPGQASQSTPAVTGQTPAATAQAQAGAVTQATAADVKKGVSVYDPKGGLVGKIDSVSAKGAVLNTGTTRAVIPVASFGKNDKGLVVSMTKSEIDAAGKKTDTKK
jgi:uncharacterized protein involved in copper resistance